MTRDDEILAPFAPAEGATSNGPSVAPSGKPVTRGPGRRRNLKVAAIGTIVAGGLAAAALVGPLVADAASPSPATANAPTASDNPPADGDTGVRGGPGHDGGPGDHRGPGRFGHNEAVSDASVVAKAIGITEADLNTALQGGKTIADVAKAHNVDTHKVIDALVQDGLDELAAKVTAGTITQAQADAMKDQVTQRATDQVNGTFTRGPGRDDGPGH